MGLALLVIILILTLTTNSWLEPYLFLFTMGVGIIINMGTNIIFGEISFISFSVAALLQLAVSMDYSIFLLHTFTEEKQKNSDITLTSMSNGLFKFRYIMAVFLMIIIIPCCIGQGMNQFNYGTGALAGGEGSKTYDDAQEIKAVFGENNMMLVMVPNTNAVMEKRLSDELDELSFVKSVASLSGYYRQVFLRIFCLMVSYQSCILTAMHELSS